MNFREKLERDGYVVIPGVLCSEQVEKLRKTYVHSLAETEQSTLLPTAFLQFSDMVNALLHPGAIQAIKDIFQSDFSLLPNFTVRESVYIPWHNDAYFLPDEVISPSAFPEFLQCAYYLQDNDPVSGGGITLLPGSHKLSKDEVKIRLAEPVKFERTIMSKAGDLVIWDNRVTHRSSAPDQTPVETKLAIQWTVSASTKHNASYITYLRARAERSLHVSDYLPNSPKPYFADMPNVRYPSSFSQDAVLKMKGENIKFIEI
ncbi:phytanoyl-CoA dioxygenase [Pseudomonas sp. BRG-100]|uniref:phytanoyl-CoA dioxygenase family protein n=1 Tax=Pseudomonas sp. BRG-100 TaxID=1524267 RepID=UPI0004E70235|nr:phytanoyl-CoA dioxygenase family protein [Pseudomonas sp. BRG-100]KFF46226.1 phytanoyl-CoA dioxygenase [Pseudomonas sp. BRG-100]